MMQTFYPGVYFQEVEFGGASRPIKGIDMSIGACVIYAEKGPIGVATKVTSLSQAQDIFGSAITTAYGYYSIEGFFKNGGKSLWIIRTNHYTSISDASTLTAVIASSTALDRHAVTPVNTLKIEASSPGSWGNNIGRKILDDKLVNTTVGTAGVSGDTSLVLTSTSGIYVGSVLTIGANTIKVSNVDHASKTIYFGAALGAGGIAKDTVVTSNEFKILVYKGTVLVESWTGLSMETEVANYVETVINNTVKGSKYITVDDQDSATAAPLNKPAIDSNIVFLTSGDDGLTNIASTDIIGNSAAKNGLYALDYVQDSFNLFCSESEADDVNRAMYQYCELRMDAFAIFSVPEGKTPAEAITYRKDTGNFNSSYGALYYSWGNVADPIGVGVSPKKKVPLDGHIAGMFARMVTRNGINAAPGGEEAILYGVDSLEITIDDTTNGALYSAEINCIRSFSGLGIVVWGVRTLSSDTKWQWIHTRKLFIYAEKSIALGTRWAVFKPSNSTTWKKIIRNCEAFLSTMPGLYGATKAEKFAVVCDETINTDAVRATGQIITKIGLNVEDIGEFIVFEIGQMREGTTLTEAA